ncbi:Alpha-(1,3)-fucosyltransferase 11-like [Oopsacas minuta]|uniref:Fucosyltransferase n=1 Tax=Oopsacas minuta TaxID=111878 RepID=A0AAV7K1X1_9METZ|nr:Alpha-(1,3)-fucosyltransferase 11-like [Oopsacas minuta]
MRNNRYSNHFYIKLLVTLVLFAYVFFTPWRYSYTEEEFIAEFPQINSDYVADNARLYQLAAELNPLVRNTVYDNLKEEDITQEFIISEVKRTAKENDIPVLIWWSNLYPDMTDFKQCGKSTCVVTRDRKIFSDKEFENVAILFYGSSVNWDDLPLPRSTQLWGLLHDESSKNNIELNFIEVLSLFNYTSTFSRYSDVPLTTMYLPTLNYLTEPVNYPPSEMQESRGSVLYIHSDCQVPTYRDLYTKELMKHITVDSYGSCLNNKEFPDYLKSGGNILKFQHEDLYKFIQGYKFTLAFENSRCDDYITEKLWRPLHMRSIPIYHGARTVKDWVPAEHSVIYAEDFNNPRELADYLKYLEANETAYEEYFSYKVKVTNQRLINAMNDRIWNYYKDGIDFIEGFNCLMCQKLDELSIAKKENRVIPPRIVDIKHYNCETPQKRLTKKYMDHFDWYGVYARGYNHAKVIRNRVLNNTHF